MPMAYGSVAGGLGSVSISCQRGFVLGYGGLPVAKVGESMRRLRACLEAESRTSAGFDNSGAPWRAACVR
jgi:hypothetical protein